MTALDLTPAPVSAPWWRRVLAHARAELSVTLRNGEQLLLAIVIPVGILVVAFFFGPRFAITMNAIAPSVLALAVWSTAFTSLAILTGFERRDGVLERFISTPLGPTGLIVGKGVAVISMATMQCAVISVVAFSLGWCPRFTLPSAIAGGGVTILAGLAFSALALIVAGRLRAEATLAVANLMYLVGVVGGVMIPASQYPAPISAIVRYLPPGALGESLRAASSGQVDITLVLVVALWAAGLTAIARKVFRWMS